MLQGCSKILVELRDRFHDEKKSPLPFCKISASIQHANMQNTLKIYQLVSNHIFRIPISVLLVNPFLLIRRSGSYQAPIKLQNSYIDVLCSSKNVRYPVGKFQTVFLTIQRLFLTMFITSGACRDIWGHLSF